MEGSGHVEFLITKMKIYIFEEYPYITFAHT